MVIAAAVAVIANGCVNALGVMPSAKACLRVSAKIWLLGFSFFEVARKNILQPVARLKAWLNIHMLLLARFQHVSMLLRVGVQSK